MNNLNDKKRTCKKIESPEITTMCVCSDCGASTRMGRHLDIDCDTIKKIRTENDELRAKLTICEKECKQRNTAIDWVFEKSSQRLPILLRKIERKTEGIEFGIDKYTIFGIKPLSIWHKTPLDAILAAMKEQKHE